MSRLIFVVLLFMLPAGLYAGSLRIDITHRVSGAPLQLNSLRYAASETYSVSRLAYLLSDFALQRENGKWQEIPNQFAYIDHQKHRSRFYLKDIAQDSYKAIRFSVGLSKKQNHADPNSHPADHPLNPNLNQLHWNWTEGYIFFALEGKYHAPDSSIKGFVYHLANDINLTTVELHKKISVKNTTGLALILDLKKLLTVPRKISFTKDGNSSHSNSGDSISSALVANFPSAFSLTTTSYPLGDETISRVAPLHLPAVYSPHPFTLSARFPRPNLPLDNPLLTERVNLGKKLFHDTQLSKNNTVSCASCHVQKNAFSDSRSLSTGSLGLPGTRHSMPLFNLAWKSSFFWDGRSPSLRDQVLLPIQDHLEMNEDLTNVVEKISRDSTYVAAFQRAFSTDTQEQTITTEKIALALENFLLTLTSYDSKFDQAMQGKAELSQLEEQGMSLFFTEFEPRSGKRGADCFHCHGGANFSDHQFHNNGLSTTQDLGRYIVTNDPADKYKFSTPSLRNIDLTPPYMHDGRFQNLEQVIDHYSDPIPISATLDPNLAKHPKSGLQLTPQEKAALVAFLKTLSDPQFWKSP